jgi:lipopolysaccharide transport system permease protein
VSAGSAAAPAERQARRQLSEARKRRVFVGPTTGWRPVNLPELWRRRELLLQLARRDVAVRYKQTVLGIAWAVLQPVAAMLIFSLVFGRLIGVPSDGVPYTLFTFAGLLPWMYFASAVTHGSTSLVTNAPLISKVYFPRLIIPISSVLPALVDLTVGLVALLVLMIAMGASPGWQIVSLPFFVFMAVAAALAITLWASALDVQYRDIRYAIPFMVQVLMFATPVVYPVSLAPPSLRALMGLNPMAGVVEGWRWALFGHAAPGWSMVAVSCAVTVFLLASGALYFRRVERSFADVI